VRILFVNTDYLPTHSTPALVASRVARELAQEYQVSVFCGHTKDYNGASDPLRYEIEGVKVFSTPIAKLSRKIDFLISRYAHINRAYFAKETYCNPCFDSLFASRLDEIRPQIVHFHNLEFLGASLVLVAKAKGIKVALQMHDWWWFCPKKFLLDHRLRLCSQSKVVSPQFCCIPDKQFAVERFAYLRSILKDVDAIIAPSQFVREWLLQNGVSTDQIHVVNEGVPSSQRFSANPGLITLATQLRFGYLGGKNQYKGLQVLQEAYRRINAGSCQMHLYGVADSPRTLASFNAAKTQGGSRLQIPAAIHQIRGKLAREGLLTVACQLIDFIWLFAALRSTACVDVHKHPSYHPDDINNILSNIDVLIVPSLIRESYSLVTREALRNGVPVICSDSGGPQEIIKNGYNGFIFRTGDSADLAEKILRFISSPSLVNQFRQNINQAEIPTVQQEAIALKSIYQSLL
jgi:glycosyltransferase involved in cell wall biosynthesis